MKTILITGATSGIGEACARHCLAQGDRVVAICRNLDKARGKFGAEIEAGRFVPLHYDDLYGRAPQLTNVLLY